jgi:hypothetical protein
MRCAGCNPFYPLPREWFPNLVAVLGKAVAINAEFAPGGVPRGIVLGIGQTSARCEPPAEVCRGYTG